MFISAFLLQIYIGLIAHKKLMTSVARIGGSCVHLITIPDVYSLKTSSYISRYRVCRTVGDAAIEHFLVVGIYQTGSDVRPVAIAIVTRQHRRRY